MGLIGKGNLLVEGDAQINGNLSVEGGISGINLDNWIEGKPNMSSNTANNGNCRFYKNEKLKIAFVNLLFTTSSAFGQNAVIGSNFPKSIKGSVLATLNSSPSNLPRTVYINAAGQLVVDYVLENGAWWAGSIVYPYCD